MNKKIPIIGMALLAAVAFVATTQAVFKSTRYVHDTLAPETGKAYPTSPYALAVFVRLDDTDPYVGLYIGYIDGEGVFHGYYRMPGGFSVEIPPGSDAAYYNPWSYSVEFWGRITSYWW